jgi:hypothetical protein
MVLLRAEMLKASRKLLRGITGPRRGERIGVDLLRLTLQEGC